MSVGAIAGLPRSMGDVSRYETQMEDGEIGLRYEGIKRRKGGSEASLCRNQFVRPEREIRSWRRVAAYEVTYRTILGKEAKSVRTSRTEDGALVLGGFLFAHCFSGSLDGFQMLRPKNSRIFGALPLIFAMVMPGSRQCVPPLILSVTVLGIFQRRNP